MKRNTLHIGNDPERVFTYGSVPLKFSEDGRIFFLGKPALYFADKDFFNPAFSFS